LPAPEERACLHADYMDPPGWMHFASLDYRYKYIQLPSVIKENKKSEFQ